MCQDVDINWKECEEKIVKPVWKRYCPVYERLGIEYGDFVGISYEILIKGLSKYNRSKSDIATYGIRILKTRMSDYIRNNYDTDKTRANFCPKSLNTPASEDSDVELEETIIDRSSEYEAENNIDKIKRFLKTLSNQQKEMLLLVAIGLDDDEVQNVMNISQGDFDRNMQKIRMPRRTSILRNGGK